MYEIKTYKENWKNDYVLANHKWYAKERPIVYASGFWFPPTFPDIRKANKLQIAICNFVKWNGYRATRISTTGRLIETGETQPSGTRLTVKKYIPGQTRRGTADVSATIKGRSVMLEVKVGRDKPSEDQLREQALERAAGGIYEFIHDMDEFLIVYNSIVNQ